MPPPWPKEDFQKIFTIALNSFGYGKIVGMATLQGSVLENENRKRHYCEWESGGVHVWTSEEKSPGLNLPFP